MNQMQLTCKTERATGGLEFSNVIILPADMEALDGQRVKVDGETIRFKMRNGHRLYVNCRIWTLGYFELVDLDLSWGSPQAAVLHGDKPSPKVAKAVSQVIGWTGYRMVEA